LRGVVLLSPTLIAALYFGFVAADRYVSEAQFVVRSAARPGSSGGLGALLQVTGLGRAQDEIFSVQAYLNSRDAAASLASRLPLREYYGRAEADAVARYPSLVFGATAEEFHRYLQWMITTSYSSTTGITTLRVQSFRPADAKAIADALLDLGEETVNQMNVRIRSDAVRLAEAEVRRNEQRLVASQVEITNFRNSELMIDPAGSSLLVAELIARLSAELSQTEAQIRETVAATPDSPQLPSLRLRAEALKLQIAEERQRISASDSGLADKLAVYERLVLDREFAKSSLSAAVRALEAAQQEARSQQIYLERIVEPAVADHALAPERLRLVATTFGLNAIFLMVGWLVFSGLREHAAAS
jgi:capsular polysaccharide transport system permease protein